MFVVIIIVDRHRHEQCKPDEHSLESPSWICSSVAAASSSCQTDSAYYTSQQTANISHSHQSDACAIIGSRLDYCNSLYYSMSNTN